MEMLAVYSFSICRNCTYMSEDIHAVNELLCSVSTWLSLNKNISCQQTFEPYQAAINCKVEADEQGILQ